MGVNKVIVGNEVKVDLTGDTVTVSSLASGTTAHNAAGDPIVGTMPTDFVRYGAAQSLTEAQKAQARQNIDAPSTDDIPDVVDNVTSTSTDDALSAKQGKLLNDRINNLLARGRFLSFWDATTGIPLTNPSGYPYPYHTGDYFIVNKVGETNYIPNGASYTGQPSTTVYTGDLKPNDSIYYDGTSWSVFDTPAGGGDIQDVYQNGTSVVSNGIAYVVTPTDLADLDGDATHRVVTDVQIAAWSGKIDDVQLNGTSVVENGVANIETEDTESVNIVTEITASSTNSQLPSAKAVYDFVGDIESIIDTIRGVN